MADGGESLTLRIARGAAAVPARDWDACAGVDNPFLSHAFFAALEQSGSASAEAGWLPQHVVAEDVSGRMAAVVPMYAKSHSYGEYVFDHGWAQAFERAGGRYYPKLQIAVPFTPVPGRRLLLRPDRDHAATRAALIRGLAEIARNARVSSLHITFATAPEVEACRAEGWLVREGFQYHWENPGYRSFEDFLAALSHGKRKAIRKERREVAEQGITFEHLTGPALTEEVWDRFFRFYTSTSDRKWGAPYLNRDFFARLGAALGERVVLVMARRDGRWIAGALNLMGDDTLYGRNWGCSGYHKHLHFETCYYQAIEFAIARGLKRVEAGAQGEHKLQRGYLPQPTWSAHWIRDRGLREAVAQFLVRETQAVEHEREALGEHSPFKITHS